MPATSDWDSVLLTDGEGAVYRVPLADLARYQLPPAEAEEMLEGDVTGFVAERSLGFSVLAIMPGTPLGGGRGGGPGGAAPPGTASSVGRVGYDLKASKKV